MNDFSLLGDIHSGYYNFSYSVNMFTKPTYKYTKHIANNYLNFFSRVRNARQVLKRSHIIYYIKPQDYSVTGEPCQEQVFSFPIISEPDQGTTLLNSACRSIFTR